VEPFPGTKCAGVDLNRNFDAHWNEVKFLSLWGYYSLCYVIVVVVTVISAVVVVGCFLPISVLISGMRF